MSWALWLWAWLCLLSLSAQAPETPTTTISRDPGGDFARAYNSWLDTRNTAASQGSIDASEYRKWKLTKDNWNTLRKQVDLFYSQ